MKASEVEIYIITISLTTKSKKNSRQRTAKTALHRSEQKATETAPHLKWPRSASVVTQRSREDCIDCSSTGPQSLSFSPILLL